MEVRKKTIEALNRHTKIADISRLRLQLKQIDPSFQGAIRVAAEIPRLPQAGGLDYEVGDHVKRDIPKEYPYDPKALKPLAKMLWAMSVSLGHAMTAHRQFTKLKSSTVSPDGLIGGRGYVMSVKDVRKALYDACEAISAVSDTIHDEINAPHWKPKLAQLEKSDAESIEHLVGDAERILDDPEGEVDDEMDEAEKAGPKADLEPKSKMPDGKGLADNQAPPKREKQASEYTYRRGNSSVPVETMQGGPRVQHLDRADVDQTGPFGSYNSEEPGSVQDEWSRDDGVGNDYDYTSEWDNDLREKGATSVIPDSNSDKTPTEGYDFGIGYGEGNDAHGQGAGGYGNTDEHGRGVYGPSTELPDDPGGKVHDDEVSDTTPSIELSVGDSSMPRTASYDRTVSEAKLPNDGEPPVARSDYYQGDKGSNMMDSSPSNVGATKLPGEQMPAKDTPLIPRPAHLGEHMFADSGLPGDDTEVDYDYAKDVHPGTGYRYERSNQPYVKWDDDTHNMRPDYVYQRDDEGPYVKQEG